MNEKKVTVTVDYELFKAMEYEIDAIRNNRHYIVRDFFNGYQDMCIIGGIEPAAAEVIERANYAIDNYDRKERDSRDWERRANEEAGKNMILKEEIESLKSQLNKKTKWF